MLGVSNHASSAVSAVKDVSRRRDAVWSPIGADMLWVGGAKIAGGAALVGLNFWVARHLGPGPYGVFAFAVMCVLLVDAVVGAALDAVVLRYAAEESAADRDTTTAVERTALVMKVAGTLVVGIAVAWFRHPLTSAFFHGAEHASVLPLAVAAGGAVLVLRSLQVRYQVSGRFAQYGSVELMHTAVRVSLVVAALYAGTRSAAPLLAAYAAAPLLVVLARGRVLMRPATLAAWWQPAEWRAVRGFAAVALGTCAVGSLVARLDVIVLAAVGAPAELGLFGIASTIAMIPTLAGASLAPSITPRILPYCRDGHFARFFATTQTVLVAAAVAIFVLAAVAAPVLIAATLPGSYTAAIPVVRVLVVSGLAGFVTFPLTLHFLLFFSPRTYLTMDLVTLPLLVPAYAYAARHHGALGVAWVTAVATVSKAVVAHLRAMHLMPRVSVSLTSPGSRCSVLGSRS